MFIRKLEITKPFRYVWLKSVRAVKLEQHCAKCLVGGYNENVNASVKKVRDLYLPDGIYYLCGVSKPYKWERNFHLAFRPTNGGGIIYADNGIEVVIDGAEQLPIGAEYIDPADPNAGLREYATCRNWQFAHYFNQYLAN